MRLGLLRIGRNLQIADERTTGTIRQNELHQLVRSAASDSVRDVGLGSNGFIAMEIFQSVNLRYAALS